MTSRPRGGDLHVLPGIGCALHEHTHSEAASLITFLRIETATGMKMMGTAASMLIWFMPHSRQTAGGVASLRVSPEARRTRSESFVKATRDLCASTFNCPAANTIR